MPAQLCRLLVVLQNEYRKGGRVISRRAWLPRLWQSHTGKRLKEMLPDNCDVFVTNASLAVGRRSDSICPPDSEHLRQTIAKVKPTLILACGRVAQRGLVHIGASFIYAPHPACRALSKEMTEQIRVQLAAQAKESSTASHEE